MPSTDLNWYSLTFIDVNGKGKTHNIALDHISYGSYSLVLRKSGFIRLFGF